MQSIQTVIGIDGCLFGSGDCVDELFLYSSFMKDVVDERSLNLWWLTFTILLW